jgi:hypothetical protein
MDKLPQSPETLPGAYRWFGLAISVVGFAVFDEWDVKSYSDFWPNRLGLICGGIGLVIYFEGLLAKVVAAVRQSRT